MSETLHTVVGRGEAFLALAREQARDGLTWQEFGRLLVELLRLMVVTLDAVSGMDGAAKKATAIAAAASLFDLVADKCVPVVAYPLWLVSRPVIRTLVLALAGGAVEALLPLTRSVNA